MSDTMNNGRTRQGLNRLRRGDNEASLTYQDEGSIPKAVPGDQDGPWVKGPPFITDRTEFFYDATINLAGTAYQFTDDINVRDWRVLMLVIDYVTATASDQLSIIPEFSFDDAGDLFYPAGVVDSMITAVNLADTNVPFEPPYGSRNFYPTELRTVALAIGDTFRTCLTFDVAVFNRFRFAVASLLAEGTTGALRLSYVLSM